MEVGAPALLARLVGRVSLLLMYDEVGGLHAIGNQVTAFLPLDWPFEQPGGIFRVGRLPCIVKRKDLAVSV